METKYFIMNLGCQMNQSDSERIQSVLEGLGYTRTEDEEEASLLGVVACSVRQKAIDKVYSKIYQWNKWKNRKNILTFVSGCILPADEEKFLTRFDLLFHIKDLGQVPDMIRQYGVVTPLSQVSPDEVSTQVAIPPASPLASLASLKAPSQDPMGGFWNITPHYQSPFEAFIPIQNGCDKFCTFCAVPYTRGREISRPSGEILSEVEALVRRGYKSITLLGQNVNSYGLDKPDSEMGFATLLHKIGEMGERLGRGFWVYFTSPHPRDMKLEVLETVARFPVLAKQIHLPLQSGDEKVLIRMNRNHSMERYREIVDNVRRILPQATLFTDIIVGFTGETEEQFENSRLAMKEFSYNMAFIAVYSPRPGAAASRWDDDIDLDEKKRRLRELTKELLITAGQYTQSMVGKTYTVLVEKPDRKDGYLAGRTEGKVLVRFASTDKSLIGQFVLVKVKSATPLATEGDQVSPPLDCPEPLPWIQDAALVP